MAYNPGVKNGVRPLIFMTTICPAILAANQNKFIDQLNLVSGWAGRLQIDLVDGQLPPANSPTVGLDQIGWPDKLQADLHLMYGRPETHLDQIEQLRPSLVIFHPESLGDHRRFISRLRDLSIGVGLALRPSTGLLAAKQLLDLVDHGLVFAGRFGRQGGEADLSQLAMVAWLRDQYPAMEIGWDGGVNPTNAGRIVRAGADVLYVGSYLLGAPDTLAAYDELVGSINQDETDSPDQKDLGEA